MKIIAIFVFAFLSFPFVSKAQSKKTIKKLNIKSTTITIVETVDDKEKTRTDAYQKFNKAGQTIEDFEYNKDATFKKKEFKKYNKNDDLI